MPRSRMIAIYGLLAVFALGAGLLIARLFGTNAALPSGYATPVAVASPPATEPPAPTAPSAGQAAATPIVVPSPTAGEAAPATATMAPPTAPPATEAPATEAPAPTAAPPTEAPAPTAVPGYVEYTVQRGDSLKSIAAKFGVTIRDIIAVNEIPNPDSLTVGSVLRIPKK